MSRAVGIDLEDPKLRAEWDTRRRGNLEFRAEEATSLSFADGEFDLVAAIEVLEHLPDPEATIAFHQIIKDNCPGVTVISIMHQSEPPRSAKGVEFYESVLMLADGVATKKPLVRLPTELTALPGKAAVPVATRGKGAVGTVGRPH